MTEVSDLVGFAAGLCTTTAFVPQVVKTWKRRQAGDIAPGTYALLVVGSALWLVHGLQVGSWPVVAANAVTLGLVVAMLAMIFRYK